MGSFVGDVDMYNLRLVRVTEIKSDLEKILNTGKAFRISSEDIIAVIKEMKESQDG